MYHPVRRYLRLPVTIAGHENNSSRVSPKMGQEKKPIAGIGVAPLLYKRYPKKTVVRFRLLEVINTTQE